MPEHQDAEGAFWRTIANGFPTAAGILHGVTADGKFLCGTHCSRDCDPRGAWGVWNQLPEAKRQPGAIKVGEMGPRDPKVPRPPAGGLILKAYQRRLEPGAGGGLTRREKSEWYGVPYEPGRDYVWMTEAEWKSLLPAQPRKGDRYSPPGGLFERIAVATLTDTSAGGVGPWHAGHLKSLNVTMTVEEVTAAEVRLGLQGSVLLSKDRLDIKDYGPPDKGTWPWKGFESLMSDDPKAHKYYDANLVGHLTYDLKKKVFSRFDVVALGEYVWENAYRGLAYGKPHALGVAFEIAPGAARGEIVPPGGADYLR